MTKKCTTAVAPVIGGESSLYDKIVEKALHGLVAKVHGFIQKETKTVYEQAEDGSKRIKSETVTVKNVGPDLSAIMFVLTNLDGRHWKNKPGTVRDADVPDDDALELDSLSDEALKMLMDSFQGPKESGIAGNVAKDESI